MTPRAELFYFGVFTLIVFLGIIAVPYLLRRRDLLTPTNFFLGGAIFFISISAIDSSFTPRVLGYVSRFSRQDYRDFMLGVGMFFFGFYLSFFMFRRTTRKVSERVFMNWPPLTRQLLLFALLVSVGLSLAVIFRVNIIGLGQILFQIGIKTSTITIVMAFVAWFYDRQNPFWLAFLIGAVLFALIIAIMSGGGRRTIVGTLFALPIAYYWLRLRYIPPQRVLVYMALAAVVLFLFVGAYSTMRRSNRHTGETGRGLSFSLSTLRQIPRRIGTVPWGQMMGQRAVECSLNAGRLYKSPKQRSLFHTAKFVACVPIPRAIWADKPKGLGSFLPKDAGSPFKATWGPGIVGHGYYDGGLWVLLIYGALAAFVLRIMDNIVVANPNNPFVLGIFASISAHLFGWLRGDIGTFTVQIIGGIIAGVILGYAGRILFGTQRRTYQVDIPRPAEQRY